MACGPGVTLRCPQGEPGAWGSGATGQPQHLSGRCWTWCLQPHSHLKAAEGAVWSPEGFTFTGTSPSPTLLTDGFQGTLSCFKNEKHLLPRESYTPIHFMKITLFSGQWKMFIDRCVLSWSLQNLYPRYVLKNFLFSELKEESRIWNHIKLWLWQVQEEKHTIFHFLWLYIM